MSKTLPTLMSCDMSYTYHKPAVDSLHVDQMIVFRDSYDKRNICMNPRPVLAFRYCHRLCLCICPCVCVCVCQSLACPQADSSAVQARITKFETEVQNTLVKITIILGDDRPRPSRSNLTWKSNFTPFWVCPHDNRLSENHQIRTRNAS